MRVTLNYFSRGTFLNGSSTPVHRWFQNWGNSLNLFNNVHALVWQLHRMPLFKFSQISKSFRIANNSRCPLRMRGNFRKWNACCDWSSSDYNWTSFSSSLWWRNSTMLTLMAIWNFEQKICENRKSLEMIFVNCSQKYLWFCDCTLNTNQGSFNSIL